MVKYNKKFIPFAKPRDAKTTDFVNPDLTKKDERIKNLEISKITGKKDISKKNLTGLEIEKISVGQTQTNENILDKMQINLEDSSELDTFKVLEFNPKNIQEPEVTVDLKESPETHLQIDFEDKILLKPDQIKIDLEEDFEDTKDISTQIKTYQVLKNNQLTHPKNARPIIQIKDLFKKYDNFVAVNKISFEVKKGEIFGILGPNGAGKTTTLEIIETILKKTSGSILVDGLDIDVYPDQIKSIIGVQLQSAGFYPNLNLLEILRLFASVYDVNIDPYKFLKKVGLEEKAKEQFENLSGGQKQRFSIATTLVADPEIIFLDEPTTGLDPQARRNLWEMILDLKKNGKTIIITTHYMEEAEELCDRIAIMNLGKILQINTTEGFIKELLDKGFSKPKPKYGATLEDVFLDLTGKNWQN